MRQPLAQGLICCADNYGFTGRPAKPSLTPAVLRAFTEALRIPEIPAAAALRACVKAAYTEWPDLIAQSLLTDQQKSRLLAHLGSHPALASLQRRQKASAVKTHADPHL